MTYQTYNNPIDYTNFYENDDAYEPFKLISDQPDKTINDETQEVNQ